MAQYLIKDVLDLMLLDAGTGKHAVAVARCNHDLALAEVPFQPGASGAPSLRELTDFLPRIRRGLISALDRPRPAELHEYGTKLFRFLIRGELAELYARLPDAHVRIQIVSNHPDLMQLPWEYLQEPRQSPGPRLKRSFVRVVRTVGHTPSPALHLQDRVTVLFVAASPKGKEAIPWPELAEYIEGQFRQRLPGRFLLRVVPNVDDGALVDALDARPRPDIFHFYGHGDVSGGRGRLLLVNPKTGQPSPLEAEALIGLLRDREIRLALLTACDTAAGDFSDDFSVLAAGLVHEGVGAVVANQFAVPILSVAAFVGTLYNQLLETGDIDLAVSAGRLKLWGSPLGDARQANLEWGVPVLYRHFARPDLYLSGVT
ncbi:MAG TPA: CHAT domain-containing protein [Gemmataceae bacterium]|nr:CHAT domain-containing protein [Gemmataceae bacterium]